MYNKMLNGKVAIVTGAGRGIGREIAKCLAFKGAVVIVNYNSSVKDAILLVQEINQNGGFAEAIQCDISDYENVREMISHIVRKYGKVDILINNAGICRDRLLARMSEEEFDSVISINLKGTFNCIRHVAHFMMMQKWGRIINISSVSGVYGNIGQANYSASKAGIIGMTKSVSKELARYGITVNAIAPGFIESEMTDKLPENIKETFKKRIPMGEFGKPVDVANLVVFLSSECANYITGQVLNIDGGLTI